MENKWDFLEEYSVPLFAGNKSYGCWDGAWVIMTSSKGESIFPMGFDHAVDSMFLVKATGRYIRLTDIWAD